MKVKIRSEKSRYEKSIVAAGIANNPAAGSLPEETPSSSSGVSTLGAGKAGASTPRTANPKDGPPPGKEVASAASGSVSIAATGGAAVAGDSSAENIEDDDTFRKDCRRALKIIKMPPKPRYLEPTTSSHAVGWTAQFGEFRGVGIN